MLWLVMCAHDVAAACRLAMADVWVRLPLGALFTFNVGMFNVKGGSLPLTWNVKRESARYANRYCDQAQTLVFVGSIPTRAIPLMFNVSGLTSNVRN